MAFSVASSLPFGLSHFQDEVVCCSTSYGFFSSGMKTAFDRCRAADPFGISFRPKNTYFGSAHSHWLLMGHDLCFSKASVAADYSDSFPDSSSYVRDHGYHPLEELKVSKRTQERKLSSAEIARTTVEGNSSALLVFPGTIHSGHFEEVSWAEFQYLIDDYGDIFIEIYDNENLLKDPGARNPVNALIGMDFTMYEKKRTSSEHASEFRDNDEIPFEDEYFEVLDLELSEAPVDWGMPVNSGLVHPIYFTKCLTQSVKMEYELEMDHPKNAVAMLGCLRPVFADEESYLRGLFHFDNSDGYFSDWTDINSGKNRSGSSSIIYRLEITRIELFSVYGVQSSISLEDFQDAEPDVVANSSSVILERLRKKGIICNGALKALCKKKGLIVEEASLIGVDSLGLDVRVYSGRGVQLIVFPSKLRFELSLEGKLGAQSIACELSEADVVKAVVTSEMLAEKQIRKLLFPRSRRKKFRAQGDGCRD